MSQAVGLRARSARADRLRVLLPRVALFVMIGVLSLAGLLGALEPTASPRIATAAKATIDQGAQAFAEGFARVYLTADAARPERRESELAAYLSDGLDPDGGHSLAHGSRAVNWTAVEAERLRGRRHTITVAAQTAVGVVHLAVPVERDGRGLLYVADYPALVGPPATNTAADAPDEDEVEDPRLRDVVERALANYLAGEKRNLLADLAPEAVVSLPPRPLRLSSTLEIGWARRGRLVAVLVDAVDDERSRWTLRYELGVVKRDRWYVRSLHVDPIHGGGSS